jgi:hypothetical protein
MYDQKLRLSCKLDDSDNARNAHDPTGTEENREDHLLPSRHLKGKDCRKRKEENQEVGEGIDDSTSKEMRLFVDTFLGCS